MIKLHSDIEHETALAVATIVHFVVEDWLRTMRYPQSHLPEAIELAVVMTGLGVPRGSISLVKQASSYWDSTAWDAFPRPFLDTQCLAYANALAAWVRDDRSPEWANALESDVRKPMTKSLKYLFKTGDSFFQLDQNPVTDPTQAYWLEMSESKFVSRQIIAVRHFESDENLKADQIERLISNLRSTQRDLILHSISTIEDLQINDSLIVEELKLFLEDRDTEIQAKAMMALTKISELDELAIEFAVKMLDSSTKYVNFSAMVALASLSSIDERAMNAVDRAFCRSLQICDYEFVGLFAVAYVKWLDDPKQHVQSVLSDNYAEYLEIGIDAVENAKEQFVELG